MQTIAIIAGDKKQSDDWIRKNGNLCNRYIYIVDKNTALRWCFDGIQYVGTCKERTNWQELQDIAKNVILPEIKARKNRLRELKKKR